MKGGVEQRCFHKSFLDSGFKSKTFYQNMNLWLKGFWGKMSQFTGEDVDPILFRSNIRLLAVWHFSTSSQELLFALFEQESSLFEQRQFDFFTTHICFTSNFVQTQLRFLHCFTEIDIKSGVFCFQNMFFSGRGTRIRATWTGLDTGSLQELWQRPVLAQLAAEIEYG